MMLFRLRLFPHTNNFRRLKSSFNVPTISKAYSPNSFEDELYKFWDEKDLFQPKKGKGIYSLILPPPNVTGTLHLGHALTATVQDVWARWKRMCGNEVAWVPGMDHAGIATQAVVEKFLEKDGITRISLGREKFLNEVWKWKNSKSSVIQSQLKTIGSSVDWTREYFTMDDVQSKAVVEALLILWNKGLIYRDEVLINWSPYLRSTISDIEINKIDIDGPTELSLPGYDRPVEFGNIVDFAYKVVGSDEEIVVSTTRVETMLGDVAVAVNPEDERYRHLWGSVLAHPFTGFEIPLVLDYNVDPKFGSGALKITPAHDRTDYLIGKSHNLPFVTVIDEAGCLINSGNFSGLKRYDAREAIINALTEKGLVRSIRPHKMCIPVCSRSGDTIELLIKPQWFLKCKGMAEKAVAAVNERKLIIKPERYTANWLYWLENIQDWCISRQLWWGHQVPFYYCIGGGREAWFPARSEEEAKEVARNAFKGSVSISRGTDVLDTWFSSALLPFSCHGWPQKTEDLKRYYPLSTLVTGNDILFFWVARMVMLGLELTDQLPFKEIFLHGIVCDSRGRKMSKSLGNIIDPEDVIKGKNLEKLVERLDHSFLSETERQTAKEETIRHFPKGIPECGVDSLRFSLLSSNVKNQYINFDVKECEGVTRFCNKLWQACIFTNLWLQKFPLKNLKSHDPPTPVSLIDQWILIQFWSMCNEVNTSLTDGDFHIATAALRNFIHHTLCDVYIESIKPVLQGGNDLEVAETLSTLHFVLKFSLKCLSPFMPFIAEQLYRSLPGAEEEKALIESSYPTSNSKELDHAVVDKVSIALSIVSAIRRLKQDAGIGNQRAQIWLQSRSNLSDTKNIIQALGRCELCFGKPEVSEEDCKVEPVNEEISVFINSQEHQHTKTDTSLTKRYDKMRKDLSKLLKMTSNEGYKQVPEHIQKSHQEKIFKLKAEISRLNSILEKRAIKI